MLRGGVLRELQRVADVVGELDDLVALVVVAEDDEAVAERRLGGGDAGVQLLIGQAEIRVRQRLALVEARLFVVGQQLDVHLVWMAGPTSVLSSPRL